jgi:catechol 2,3-dioxygenase-like lactoylglutathione lyase family enzyme
MILAETAMKVAIAVACVVVSLAAGRAGQVGQAVAAAAAPRPHILGIAHVGLYVHDIEQSRVFYRDFLGYVEAYPLKDENSRLSLTFFKINDRQFLELFPEREAAGDRLAHVALQTDDAEAMRAYLKSRGGVTVPEKARTGRTGNINFTVKDPDGHTIEFVQYGADAPMTREKGAFLGPDRVSPRLRHAGILVGSLQPAIAFYGNVLGLRETWRGSRDAKVLNWVTMQVPDGDDYIEFMLYRDLPEPARRGSEHHVSLEVSELAPALKTLESRAAHTGYTRAMEIRTGINRKRHLNLYDPDGTRCELMEAATVDGKPAVPATAPPPR